MITTYTPGDAIGTCEHCHRQFRYRLIHNGFNESSYAYCDSCGTTALLSFWSGRLPLGPNGYVDFRAIPPELETELERCTCGGTFKGGGAPRCPHCNKELSPTEATSYIERNAAGTKKGWRWQKNWNDLYCIIVEDRRVEDNFKAKS